MTSSVGEQDREDQTQGSKSSFHSQVLFAERLNNVVLMPAFESMFRLMVSMVET
jgi:hypothetical protein